MKIPNSVGYTEQGVEDPGKTGVGVCSMVPGGRRLGRPVWGEEKLQVAWGKNGNGDEGHCTRQFGHEGNRSLREGHGYLRRPSLVILEGGRELKDEE